MNNTIDEIPSNVKEDTELISEGVDLKILKSTRDLLRLLKITMSQKNYDGVIMNLINHYKRTKIQNKKD